MTGKSFKRYGVSLIAIAALVLAITALPSGGVIHATGPDPLGQAEVVELLVALGNAADHNAAFDLLTAREQHAIIDAMSSIEIVVETESGTGSAAGDGATAKSGDEETSSWHAQSMFGRFAGITLWKYRSKTKWWYNGSELTRDPSWTRQDYVYYAGWEFAGHVDEDEEGGEGDWSHYDYTEGHFRWCLTSQGCVKHEYPQITKNQYANGDFNSSTDSG